MLVPFTAWQVRRLAFSLKVPSRPQQRIRLGVEDSEQLGYKVNIEENTLNSGVYIFRISNETENLFNGRIVIIK